MKATKDAVICGAKEYVETEIAANMTGGKLRIRFLESETTLDKEEFEKIYLCIKSK